jgi:hypothetical protein
MVHNYNYNYSDLDLEKRVSRDEILLKVKLSFPKIKTKIGLINMLEEIQIKEKEIKERKQKLIEDQKRIFYEQLEVIPIIWDDIQFENNLIKIKASRIKRILNPIVVPGVLGSLNKIKNEYFERLYSNLLFIIKVDKNEVIKEASPGFNKIIKTIEFANEFYNFKYASRKSKTSRVKKFDYLKNSEIINLFSINEKSLFLKILASKAVEEYKIIPILEYINSNFEESFIFPIPKNNTHILIFWENVNQGRATHVFLSEISELNKSIKSIENFITRNDIVYKRSTLHNSDLNSIQVKKNLNYYTTIIHKDLENYKEEINQLICNS